MFLCHAVNDCDSFDVGKLENHHANVTESARRVL